MSGAPSPQDFSTWNGTPFFDGEAALGRQAYVVKDQPRQNFIAHGCMAGAMRGVFAVQGRLSDVERFENQMVVEGAVVIFGKPPYDTNTGGDKPTSASTKPGRADAA